MREIKFRAWDRNHNKFYYSPDLDDLDGARRWFAMLEDEDIGAGFAPLQQYTGLKDKNGKEIYESDIVSYKLLGCNHTQMIEWDDREYSFGKQSGFYVPNECEIIGNKFKNPKLK